MCDAGPPSGCMVGISLVEACPAIVAGSDLGAAGERGDLSDDRTRRLIVVSSR